MDPADTPIRVDNAIFHIRLFASSLCFQRGKQDMPIFGVNGFNIEPVVFQGFFNGDAPGLFECWV